MLLVVLACKHSHQCLESIPAFGMIVVLLEKDIQTQVYLNKLFWSLTRNLTADKIRNTCVLKCFCCYSSGKEKTLLIGDGKDNIPSSSHRNVLSQPLIISGHGTNARINVRKLNELAHHLALADRITELREKVGRWHGMHVKKMPIPCSQLSKCIYHNSLCLCLIGCVCVSLPPLAKNRLSL